VARDFAVAAHTGALLDLDERPNLAAIADFTTVKVDEVVDGYIAAELNVGSDYTKLLRHGLEAPDQRGSIKSGGRSK
jgi:hypothetical protein